MQLSPLKETLISILDKVAPIKEVSLKQRTEPWKNSEILNYIRENDICLFVCLFVFYAILINTAVRKTC